MSERPHPAEDPRITTPLVKGLQRHVDTLAGSIDLPDQQAHQVAAAWVYTTAILAWLEDHGLVEPALRPVGLADAQVEHWGHMGLDHRGFLAAAVRMLSRHPGSASLLDPRYSPIGLAAPGAEEVRGLLGWWPTAPSFAYTHPTGPASVTGWMVGDLLQHITDERRKNHALVQTPWWLADFILSRTVPPAAADFDDPVLSLIDPTCGTGHFLVRAVTHLYVLHTTGEYPGCGVVPGRVPVGPAEAVRRILAGVTGVELDPLTAAVARLRVTVTVADVMHRNGLLDSLTLRGIPRSVRPRVAVADSLLGGLVDEATYRRLRPAQAAIWCPSPQVAAQVWERSGQLSLFEGAA